MFLTSTPISNTPIEMHTILRYLNPQILKRLNLNYFDEFKKQVVDISDAFEVTPGGSLKKVSRLGRTWNNLRLLMNMYQGVTDQVTIDQIKQTFELENPGEKFPIPETISGNERDLVLVEPTVGQRLVNNQLAFEEKNLPNYTKPGVDASVARASRRLQIQNVALANAVSARCVNSSNQTLAENSRGGKLEACAENMHRIYQKWHKDKGAQLIFLDRGVVRSKNDNKELAKYDELITKRNLAIVLNNVTDVQKQNEQLEKYDDEEIEAIRSANISSWSAYQELKDHLIAKGINSSEIIFIQEANTSAQKQKLFDAVNKGDIRVLIGSSQKMGSGTNAQERLVALHQLDIKYRVSDILQREGRLIRQGNKLLEKYGHDKFKVENLIYGKEQSFDAKLFSIIATKAKSFNAIRNYKGEHSITFEDEQAISLSELSAITSGNPLLLEKVQLEEKIKQLNIARNADQRSRISFNVQIKNHNKYIENAPLQIKQLQYEKIIADKFLLKAINEQNQRSIQIDGQKFISKIDAQKFVKEHNLSDTQIEMTLISPYLENGIKKLNLKQVMRLLLIAHLLMNKLFMLL